MIRLRVSKEKSISATWKVIFHRASAKLLSDFSCGAGSPVNEKSVCVFISMERAHFFFETLERAHLLDFFF